MSWNALFFWVGGVGGGLLLPAWMFWLRRRCLADERFPKDADGKGIFAGQTVDEADQALLMRWQRRMVAGFIAGMAFLALLVIGSLILLVIGSATIPLESDVAAAAFLLLLILVALAAMRIQLSAKCPRCEYRIGLQSRLLLPKACERCGVAFRSSVSGASR